jgi:hypothetical protein
VAVVAYRGAGVKRVVITGHEGEEFEQLAAVTLPLMEAYANRHGAAFMNCQLPAFIKRPPSWKKLIAIAGGFSEYDEVLWLDTDVVVVDSSESLFEAVPAADHAMVRHQTNEGDVPNAGVWFLRRAMLPILVAAAMMDDAVHHRWWEQAAMLSLMGFSEQSGRCRNIKPTHLFQRTHWLDESWNSWVCSPPDVSPRFRHACGLAGERRLSLVKGWADAAT